jgi:hypothetical protein
MLIFVLLSSWCSLKTDDSDAGNRHSFPFALRDSRHV